MNSEIIKLRRQLHQNPELSGHEINTVLLIKKFIQKNYNTEIIENIGGNGLAAIYDFGANGHTITIRCELDALPIREKNTFPYKSNNEGISHKCGHDGHMAIVAGLLFWIKEQAFKSGKIILLFQPAEETGKGALKVINDKKFQNLNSDYIFALHNIPKEPMHSIITMKKGFSAEVKSVSIDLKGKETHAATPENGINPSLAISEIIVALSKLNKLDPLRNNFTVLTAVHLKMGQKSYGISPENGELHYTVRTWSRKSMVVLENRLENMVKTICAIHNLEYSIKWFEHFPASENNEICNQEIIKAAKSNRLEIIHRSYPFKFGEDFGWFSKRYKTAMFGIGSGMNTPDLHNADYDFPEEILKTGIDMFSTLIKNLIKKRTT